DPRVSLAHPAAREEMELPDPLQQRFSGLGQEQLEADEAILRGAIGPSRHRPRRRREHARRAAAEGARPLAVEGARLAVREDGAGTTGAPGRLDVDLDGRLAPRRGRIPDLDDRRLPVPAADLDLDGPCPRLLEFDARVPAPPGRVARR